MARTSAKRAPQATAHASNEKPARRAKSANRLAVAWLLERKRRAAADAKPGDKGVRLALGLTMLAGVMGLAVWFGGLADPGLRAAGETLRAGLIDAGFTVAHVEVRGARRAEADEVAAALAIAPGSLIFDLDPNAAKARVETIGWVREAAVLRLLPNRVVVLIDERRPLALWDSPDGVVVLDAAGHVIAGADPGAYDGLPRLEGAAAPAAAGELVDALSRYPALARRVGAFERIGDRRWDMVLKSGLLVRLPEGDAAAALDHLTMLEERQRVLELPLDILDLRGDDLVLRPRDLPPYAFQRGA